MMNIMELAMTLDLTQMHDGRAIDVVKKELFFFFQQKLLQGGVHTGKMECRH